MAMKRHTLSACEELARVNAELAALFQEDPVRLADGADRSLSDPLVICGILGGKDVGKSTLINALSEATVSVDHEEVGVGTTRPMAYIHHDSISKYHARFQNANGLTHSLGDSLGDKLDITEHNVDNLRNVVLVDLPDFDSELPHHRKVVESVAPLLDRLVWVVTPRKIADRTWVSLFTDVIKDRQNIYCVLNKTDELLSDDTYANGLPSTFLDEQTTWFRDLIEQAGCPHDNDHLFVLAAETPTSDAFVDQIGRRWGDSDWQTYIKDREAVATIGQQLAANLARLQACILSPLKRQDAEAIKQANQRAETLRNADTIRGHYDLDDWIGELDQACDTTYYQALTNDVFGEDFCEIVGRRLRRGQRGETELADELLAERVDKWPILPVIFWPTRWFVRRLGARFAGTRWTPHDIADDAFLVRGQSLTDRLEAFRTRLGGDHARVVDRFDLACDTPGTATLAHRLGSRSATLVAELDDELIETLNQTYKRPCFFSRMFLWFMLIWFPFGQPLAEGCLQVLGADGEVGRLTGLIQVVRAFGAIHLLTGLVFVALVYTIILATMFARCVGIVRRARRGSQRGDMADETLLIAERIDALIVSEIVGTLSEPFVNLRQRMLDLRERIEQLS